MKLTRVYTKLGGKKNQPDYLKLKPDNYDISLTSQLKVEFKEENTKTKELLKQVTPVMRLYPV